jgi:hypothetical protein
MNNEEKKEENSRHFCHRCESKYLSFQACHIDEGKTLQLIRCRDCGFEGRDVDIT